MINRVEVVITSAVLLFGVAIILYLLHAGA